MEEEEEDRNNVWLAAADGSVGRVLELLARETTIDVVDENGYTPLMASAAYGHLELARELLLRGAKPNLQDGMGNTSLHHCEYAGVVAILAQFGVDPTVVNEDGLSAIQVRREELREGEENDNDDEDAEANAELKMLIAELENLEATVAGAAKRQRGGESN